MLQTVRCHCIMHHSAGAEILQITSTHNDILAGEASQPLVLAFSLGTALRRPLAWSSQRSCCG